MIWIVVGILFTVKYLGSIVESQSRVFINGLGKLDLKTIFMLNKCRWLRKTRCSSLIVVIYGEFQRQSVSMLLSVTCSFYSYVVDMFA